MTLIERLQQADGPSRELDAAIWYAAVEKPSLGDKLDSDMRGKWPRYTASLDAAMSLVPDGWRWEVANFVVDVEYTRSVCAVTGKPDEAFSISDGAFAMLERPDIDQNDPDKWPWNGDWLGVRYSRCGIAATPALALCIAALSAREASNG